MKITINNRLAILIRQRQINSASEFARRMTAGGYTMSSSHASRYEKENSPAFDLKFVNVACNVLQCLPNELYDIQVELEPDEDIDPLVILPRHAIITRRLPTSNEGAPPATIESQPLPASKTTQAVVVPEKAPSKREKKSAPASTETGPSGVLFPFKKE